MVTSEPAPSTGPAQVERTIPCLHLREVMETVGRDPRPYGRALPPAETGTRVSVGQRQSRERVAEPEQVELRRGRRGALWRRA